MSREHSNKHINNTFRAQCGGAAQSDCDASATSEVGLEATHTTMQIIAQATNCAMAAGAGITRNKKL
jgi:hypothetical protein